MKQIGAACIALAAAVSLAACGSGSTSSGSGGDTTTAAADSPVTLGFAIGESGFMEPYDAPARTAAQFAIDDLAAEGGTSFRIVSANTKSKPELSGNAATQVIDDGADVVVTSCDFDQGSPAAIVAQQAGKLAFSTCAASTSFGPAGIGPLAFTMATAAPVEGAAMAEWAYERQGWRTAYSLLDDTIDFTKQSEFGFAERFEAIGGRLLGRDTFKQGDQSIAAQITKIKGLPEQPAAIYLASYMPTQASVIKQLRAAGLEMPILGDEDLDGDYWKEAVPGVSDVYYATYASIYGDDPDPVVNRLVERFTADAGRAPDTASFLTGYAMVQAIDAAVRAAGATDGAALQRALEQMTDERFVLPTTFDARDHIAFERTLRILEIQDGRTRLVEQFSPADVPVPGKG